MASKGTKEHTDKSRAHRSFMQNLPKGSVQGLLEELYQDMYDKRWQLYKLNFMRGIFFAFGSVMGGTVIIALLIWILSLFDTLPIAGHFIDTVRQTLESRGAAN